MAKLQARIVIEKMVDVGEVPDLEFDELTGRRGNKVHVANNEKEVFKARIAASKAAEKVVKDSVGKDGVVSGYVAEVTEL